MSQWTHVNGNIRFDALRGLVPKQEKEDLMRLLGCTCTFDDTDDSICDSCNTPCGSEGSLQYHISVNPLEHSLVAYSVSIWGDLRDYQDLTAIKSWFETIVMGWKMIRGAVLEVEIEMIKTVLLIPVEKDSKIVGIEEIDITPLIPNKAKG